MFELKEVEVVYDQAILALRGASLTVEQGAIVALLGTNGAGKTTVLRACTGLLRHHRGRITRGQITLDGRRVDQLAPSELVRLGIAQVMEGRRILGELTVEENLRLGGYTRPREVASGLRRMYDLFPVLEERRKRLAGYLSGGEQQMLAIGRALMSRPRCLLLDEPSLGLAPKIVEQIRDLLVDINRDGTTILLVEQNAAMALAIATHGYVVETGRIALDLPAAELRAHGDVHQFYLGLGPRRSYRQGRQLRRSARWAA